LKTEVIVSLFSAALLGATALGQAQDDSKLPRLDLFSGKRTPLGYENTPLATPKKATPPPKKDKGQTEITALEATFDQKSRQAVFIGDVLVKDPEFNVNCDRLTAFLKNQKEAAPAPAKAAGAKPATPAAKTTPAAKEAPASQGGGLDHAIAESASGKQVLITQDKVEADGSITKNVGHSRKATYDAKSGDIVLTGNPSVQQGINLCVATADETVMTLNRNGQMRVNGPHKTVIKDTASANDNGR